ncbi:MAG: hypothetical protein IAE82_18770 [Opitutaceae bacterium]|nr:hypothetical protein [Opitutaceae bacterium]
MAGSTPDPSQPAPVRIGLWPRLAWLVAAGAIALTVVFAFLQFRLPGHGFTYVFDFGETLGLPRLPEIDATPTYIHPAVPGYDGQMYAQLALRPAADDPELLRVIDNPPYRARRAFMGWVSWVLGFGRPWWVLNVHACLNLACWLALSVLLLRWFSPRDGVDSLVRWAGVLLSAGMLSSMRHAVTDGPALLALAGAVALAESGRRWAAVGAGAAAGLTRETSVLLGAAFLPQRWRDGRGWLRAVAEGAILVLPLALWMWRLRDLASSTAYHNSGVANFTWPFAGFVERWAELVHTLLERGWQKTAGAALLAHLALTVNMLWILVRPRWTDRWWRIGAVHVLLLAALNTQVWEGYPGASARVLLPLVLAFNLLAPRGRRGLVLLVAGNLSIFSGMLEMSGPPQPVWTVQGSSPLAGGHDRRAAISVEMGDGFYGLEGRGSNTWQWTSGDAVVRLHNTAPTACRARVRLELRSPSPRVVVLRVHGADVWAGEVTAGHQDVETATFDLPPGVTALEIAAGQGEIVTNAEGRPLALRIFALDLIVDR